MAAVVAWGKNLIVESLPNEKWRGGTTFYGNEQPYGTTPRRDLSGSSYFNPCAPFFVSSAGRYVWSDRPFAFSFKDGRLTIDYTDGEPRVYEAGSTLKEAYLAASRRHFPPTGAIPDELFFAKPQFNTWIESQLVGNGQAMVENYVAAIVSNRFPCGVFMVDDGWAPKDRYGDLTFNRTLFPDPARIFRQTRTAGFRTLLWLTPYVFEGAAFHAEGDRRNLFLRHPDTGRVYAGSYWPTLPACGVINLLDPNAWAPIEARYRDFMRTWGFDGYKFDFTDAGCLANRDRHTNAPAPLPPGKVAADYTEAWGRFASSFAFNELRAGWKVGGLPLVCRLQDKRHSWQDLQKLVPDMISAGLLGCAYTCPDMIGGGDAGHFAKARDEGAIDGKLFVRSAQVQAMMPMMQFSAAPWRLLKPAECDACRKAAELHVAFAPEILSLARAASQTGEPIVRHMEYEFPHQGFDSCLQQFMLGPRWIVAPVVSADDSVEVRLPAGRWRDDLGVTHVGPKALHLKDVPLERLPRFKRAEDEAHDDRTNPERGYRYEIRIGCEEGEPVPEFQSGWPFDAPFDDGVTVAQAYCYLKAYVDSPVSTAKIEALERDFTRARERGVKYLLRFAYESKIGERCPTLDRILGHIRDLTPVIRRNADVLYALQIGWVGLWGEFHTNPLGLDKDPSVMATLVKATLEMLPENRSTMMRRQTYREQAAKRLGVNVEEMHRVGFFNDGTLANYEDGGTFIGQRPFATEGCLEFDAVTRQSIWYPVDGELFWNHGENPVYSSGLAAIKRLALHHYTTFSVVHGNKDLDMDPRPGAIDAWKATPLSADQLRFSGLKVDERYFAQHPSPTAYEYIRDHLGYRLGVVSFACERSADGKTVSGKIRVRNDGFARPVNPRKVWIVLLADDGVLGEFQTGVDARSFAAGETTDIPFEATPGSTESKGPLRMALWLPDEADNLRLRPEYAVAFSYGVKHVLVGGRLLNVLGGVNQGSTGSGTSSKTRLGAEKNPLVGFSCD